MAPNRRRMNTYNAPKVEIVRIDPPKAPEPEIIHNKQEPKSGGLGGIGGAIGGIFNSLKNIKFDGEDMLLIGLMLLFLNMDDEEYSLMLPALIYIFLG